MFRFRRMQPVLVSVLTVAVFVVGITTTEAARKDPGLPGNHLVIEEVTINFDQAVSMHGQLTIRGGHFEFGNTLAVTLGPGAVTLDMVSTSDTILVYNLPMAFLDGDYLLTVSTGNGQSQNDEYDLTIGAVGPAGADGLNGMDGQDGADGEQGEQGPAGQAGDPTALQTVTRSCRIPEDGRTVGFQKSCIAECAIGEILTGCGYEIDTEILFTAIPTTFLANTANDSCTISVSQPGGDESWALFGQAICLSPSTHSH